LSRNIKKCPKAARIRIIDCCQRSNKKKLKETLSNALNSFEGKGLTVEQKNGKVYVSMENKLLFNSGSWAVGSEGKSSGRTGESIGRQS
jgi:chemotaxis protein MotB